MVFIEEIQQGIVAVTVAMLSASVAHGGGNVEYCRGVLDSAKAQGLNYGISWGVLMCELKESLQETDLLELIVPLLSGRCLPVDNPAENFKVDLLKNA